MYHLLIKRHNVTGLLYLCKREKNDWETYKGSGKHWKSHIKKHGASLTTIRLFSTDDKDLFKIVCEEMSEEFDVVNSKDWANLVPETGEQGGGNHRVPHSDETKRKLSIVLIGRQWKLSEKTKIKMRKPKTEQHAGNIGRAKLGNDYGKYTAGKPRPSVSALKWCNDGTMEIRTRTIPIGFEPGRLKRAA